jgi:hypothetical protein
MSFTLSGSIITQSGQTSSTRDTPATLSTWAAANGLSANIFLTGRQLTIQGNYRLHINGFYDDTGYINNIASGSRIRFGDSCDWLSGEQVHQSSSNVSGFQGISVKGAKWICNSWTVDESINLGNAGKLRWYGVDINSDRNIAIGSDTRSDLIFNGTSLDAQFFDCFFVPRGNHRLTGNANVKATGCFFGFGPFYFNGDLQGFINNTIGSYVTNEVRCNIDNGRTMKGATLKFPLTTTNWVLNLGAITDIRTYQDLGLPSTLNYAGVVGYQGGVVNLTRSFSLPIVKAESPTTAITTATLYRQELGVLVPYLSSNLPTAMLAYTWKWTNSDFSFRAAHVTEDRRLCNYFIVDYARNIVTGQIDASNGPFTGKAFLPIDSSITQVNQITVSAYTSCETPQKAYDLSKLWMVNNYTGQTEPSLSRTGNTITTTKNVVIDPNASTAYSETATTITLKTNAFTGSMTVPSVSLVNGASVSDNVSIDRIDITFGTIRVSDNGAVTGTGTAFSSSMVGGSITINNVAYIVSAYNSPTYIIIRDVNNNYTYSGGSITMDTTYVLRYGGKVIYNTDSNIEITLTNTLIDTVENLGTGIVTINKVNSTIRNYTDAEINFIDSTIAVIGADTVTFHPTANERDLNKNSSGSFTSSYSFKFGSTINGSLMSGTLYLRCVAGGIPFNIDKEIILGDNLVNLGPTAQLASLSAKIDLTAKEASLNIVNQGVQNASKFKPHSTNL